MCDRYLAAQEQCEALDEEGIVGSSNLPTFAQADWGVGFHANLEAVLFNLQVMILQPV